MKPLTPEEQIQMQLDVSAMKSKIEDLKAQIEGLSHYNAQLEKSIFSTNDVIKSHHELLAVIADKVKSL